jgi:hypothetical protein
VSVYSQDDFNRMSEQIISMPRRSLCSAGAAECCHGFAVALTGCIRRPTSTPVGQRIIHDRSAFSLWNW